MSLGMIHFPIDARFHVVKALFDSYGVKATSDPWAIRATCQDWKWSTDSVLVTIFAGFKKHPPMGPLRIDYSFSVEVAQRENSSVVQLFAKLNKGIKQAQIDLPKGTRLVSRAQLNKIQDLAQAKQDQALKMCWPVMRKQVVETIGIATRRQNGEELEPHSLKVLEGYDMTQPLDLDLVPNRHADASTIRTYLGQQTVATIFNYDLNLVEIGIDTVPLELLLLTQLKHLNLGHNQLRGITIDLNLLKKLDTLTLSNNPLEELPTDFNPPSLTFILLPPTTQIPETLSSLVRVCRTTPLPNLSERDSRLIQDLQRQME
jgi:hypothetical protein